MRDARNKYLTAQRQLRRSSSRTERRHSTKAVWTPIDVRRTPASSLAACSRRVLTLRCTPRD
eukprot:3365264-Prymnesium_polylepis.1